MKIEDQVVSLELAKQLNKLGVKQESIWYWIDDEKSGYFLASRELHDSVAGELFAEVFPDAISTFTVAELGEMLQKKTSSPFRNVDFGGNSQHFWGRSTYDSHNEMFERDKNEANARAKALIWLIEKGHINIKDTQPQNKG